MLNKKRTKSSRQRGSASHGWGHKKKHRGSGHRGGFGLSGTGARGDQQNPSVLTGSKSFFAKLAAKKGMSIKKLQKNYQHFGKKGFTARDQVANKVLSLTYIENNFDKMVEQGIITKDKTNYEFDAQAAGYDKILGRGTFTKKLTIKVDFMSQSAKTKVEEAGGKVVLLSANEFEEAEE